jgi:hypothetical protein
MARNLQSLAVEAARSVRRPSGPNAAGARSRTHGGRMKSILDPTFTYTPAASTDLRKTFARVRREMRKQARLDAETSAKVSPIFDRQSRVVASRSR